jgi:hypothetical protein
MFSINEFVDESFVCGERSIGINQIPVLVSTVNDTRIESDWQEVNIFLEVNVRNEGREFLHRSDSKQPVFLLRDDGAYHRCENLSER